MLAGINECARIALVDIDIAMKSAEASKPLNTEES